MVVEKEREGEVEWVELEKKKMGGCVFFFQAEDGIRDHCVTGVQTCALPISGRFQRQPCIHLPDSHPSPADL